MATSQAANLAEKALGHDEKNTIITPDVSNPAKRSEWSKDGTMKALAWMGKNDVRVIDTAKPKIIDDNDVIVKVTGSTICGSDIHLLHGIIVQLEKGDILGHEFCGVVEEVGPAVKDIKPGQRVVNSFVVSCGQCDYCKKNLTTACENTNASALHTKMYGSRMGGIFGYSHFVGGYAGGQAEYVRVPFGDQNLLKLPDSVPDEKGLYLSDVLVTSYHAVHYTGVEKGDTVAIWGLGPIGLLSAIWAFKAGASRVIGIDNNWRTKFAEERIKGIETLDFTKLPRKRTVADEIHQRVPGGVDLSIEAAGGEYAKSWAHYFELAIGAEQDSSEIVNECLASTRKFGKVGVIADYVGYTNHFNIGSLMERGIKFIGCGQCPVQKYWKDILKMVEQGEIDPTVILTHRIKLEDTAKGYYKIDKKEDGIVKFYIETKFSGPRAQGTPEPTEL